MVLLRSKNRFLYYYNEKIVNVQLFLLFPAYFPICWDMRIIIHKILWLYSLVSCVFAEKIITMEAGEREGG